MRVGLQSDRALPTVVGLKPEAPREWHPQVPVSVPAGNLDLVSALVRVRAWWHIRRMTSSVALYEALTTAPDDRTRARVIAEAFERLEERYPHLPDLATQGHVRESELRLQRDIEQIRADLKADIEQVRAELKADIEQIRAELKADIEQIRAELHQTELRLQKEIEQIRSDLKLDIERLRTELASTKVDLLKWIVPLMLGQVALIVALVKLL